MTTSARMIVGEGQVRQTSAVLTADAVGGKVSLVLRATGAAILLGSFVDLSVLWVLQRQAQPQWEFVAMANTLEAFPRFLIALAFFFTAQYFVGSRSLLVTRLLGGGLVLLGLVAAALGAILTTAYLALSQVAAQQPQAEAALRSLSFKAVALSTLFFLILTPVGVLVMRKPVRK